MGMASTDALQTIGEISRSFCTGRLPFFARLLKKNHPNLPT